MSIFWRLLALTIVAALTACQSAEDMQQDPEMQNQPIDTEGMANGCFYVRQVNDFEVINRVNLIVYLNQADGTPVELK